MNKAKNIFKHLKTSNTWRQMIFVDEMFNDFETSVKWHSFLFSTKQRPNSFLCGWV